MITIFNNLTQGIIDNVIYIAIFILFVIGLLSCIFPVIRNIFALRAATRKIKTKGEAVLDEELFRGKYLAQCWESFRYENERMEEVASHCEISLFFNDRSMITIPEKSQFSDILPGIFTSLGILGTFLGLMDGIGGINTSSAAEMQSSISTLLGGMKFAFRTSIVGVIFAIAYNLIRRFVNSIAQKTVRDFVQTCNMYLYDSFTADNEMLSVMRRSLDHQEHLAEVIRNELVDALKTEIRPNFVALRGAIVETAKQNQISQHETLQMIQQSQNEMTASLRDGLIATMRNDFLPAMSNIEQAFKTFAVNSESRQNEMLSIMRKSLENQVHMAEVIRNELLDTLKTEIQPDLEALLGAIIETATQSQKSQIEALQIIQQSQNEMAASLRDELMATMRNDFLPAMTNMEQAFKTFAANSENRQIEGMQKLIQEFTDAMNILMTDQIAMLGKAIEQTCDMQNQQYALQKEQQSLIEEALDALKKNMDDVTRIEQVYRSTIEGFTAYATKAQETQEQIKSVTDILTTQYTDLVDQFAAQYADFIDQLGEHDSAFIQETKRIAQQLMHFTENVEEITELVEEMKSSVENTVGEFQRITSEVNANMTEVMRKTIDASITHSKEIEEQIETGFEKLTANLDNVGININRAATAAGNQMQISSKHLSEAYDNFAQNIAAGLGQSFSGFDKAMSEAIQHLLQIIEGMQESIDAIPKSLNAHTEKYISEIAKYSENVHNLIAEYETKKRR